MSLTDYEKLPIWKMKILNDISIEKLDSMSRKMGDLQNKLNDELDGVNV
jgi:hypothetical protein